jgi:NAD(P)-dependent dehydrogenase (short-subunit alcohol dehydrogenase family)
VGLEPGAESVGLVDGKVVLITGAASGIGRASSLAFAMEGADVLVVDINLVGAEATVADICERGGHAHAYRADVTREDDVVAMVRAATDRFGRLDCAHNNAGITRAPTPLHELPLREWDRMISIDLTSVFLCLKHEIAYLRSRGEGGAIVNTASGAGIIGFPGLGDYVAAKHGVVGVTKTAALECISAGIRVNAICPGVTDTPMLRGFIGDDPDLEAAMRATLPTGTFGQPVQLAEAAVWLCSDRASWVSGESMLVDGASVCR